LSCSCCLLERDGAGGTSVGTGAALGALIGVDRIDITLRDSANGAFVDTSAASYAVFTNFVSHSFLYLIVNRYNIRDALVFDAKILKNSDTDQIFYGKSAFDSSKTVIRAIKHPFFGLFLQ
jgi:hypothetical protein